MLLQMDYLKHFFLGFYKSYLYPVIPVALYTSLLYAVSLFIMKSLHCFGKKMGKLEHVLSLIQRIFGKSTKYFPKLSKFLFITNFLGFTDLLTGLNWPAHCEKDGIFSFYVYYLSYFDL